MYIQYNLYEAFELFPSFLIWVIIRKNIPSFPQTMNSDVMLHFGAEV